MYRDQKIVVVMPAYNAAQTLRMTYDEVMAQEIVDMVILVDDGSSDETVSIARTLPNTIVHVHNQNRGYGGNQRSTLFPYTTLFRSYTKIDTGNGFDDWKRALSLRTGVQDIRWLRPQGRDADMEIHCKQRAFAG